MSILLPPISVARCQTACSEHASDITMEGSWATNNSSSLIFSLEVWTGVMIHYSCDRCKRAIEAEDSVRYVVKMEIEAAIEPSDQEFDDCDQDCLLEMDEVLDRIEDELLDEDNSVIYQRKRFDLCADCYREFVKNPFGREKLIPFGFSHN